MLSSRLMSILKSTNKNLRAGFENSASAIAGFLLQRGVTANALTYLGLILSGVAGLAYSTGAFFLGGSVTLLAGACDTLDGALARKSVQASRFGAFMDSAFDRFGEIFIFLGLIWYFSGGYSFEAYSPITALFTVLAVTGSMMVSYTRARAEGLGLECKVGLLQRPERMIILILGSWLGALPVIGLLFMKATLFTLAVLANFTAIQRILYVRKKLLEEDRSA